MNVLTLLASAVLASPIYTGPLALDNGDFEEGDFTAWDGHWGHTSEVTTVAGHGSKVAHLGLDPANVSNDDAGLYQDVALTSPNSPPARLRAELAFAIPGGEALTGAAKATLRVELFDGDGNNFLDADYVFASADHQPTSDAWSTAFVVVDAPLETANARFVVLLNDSAGTGSGGLLLDDLSFEIVTPICGDRIVDARYEVCDTAELSSETVIGACRPDCSGIVGDAGDSDGCTASPVSLLGLALALAALAARIGLRGA